MAPKSIAKDPMGFARRLEHKFGNPPPELAETKWRFYEVTNQEEIEKISQIRQKSYIDNEINDLTDSIYDWDNGARHFALAYHFPSQNWELSKSLKVITRSTEGVLPTELGINCDFTHNDNSNYPKMSSQDAIKFKNLVENHDPSKTIEISGIVSHSKICTAGSLYRLFGCMSLFYDSLGDDALIIQSSSPAHAQLYKKGSGVNYQFLAGNPKAPYRDHNGRPAVALYLDPSSFRNSFYPMMAESDFIRNILVSTYDLDTLQPKLTLP